MLRLLITIAIIIYPYLSQADDIDWWVVVQIGGSNSSAIYQSFGLIGQPVGGLIQGGNYTGFVGYVPGWTPQTGKSNQPFNLQAKAISSTQVSLSWQDTSISEAGFVIERRMGDGEFMPMDVIGKDINNYQDSDHLISNTTYTYRLQSYNEYGTSSWVTATVTTMPAERKFTPYNNLFYPDKQEAMQIRYILDKPEHVTIRIYTLSGRLIKTLLDETMLAGEHWLPDWHGEDEENKTLASGTYIIYFSAGDFKDLKKAVIIR
ncbi:MAG: fibronectin type III domain-containing protein [bacterium]|nr:fibronectin type III domain-containing protein [bacterium]